MSEPKGLIDKVNYLKPKVHRRLRRWRYKITGSPFTRERGYVKAGIREHKTAELTESTLFLLRRNVHRLEKGLTMRPIRSQFATDYIERTVRAYESAVGGGILQPSSEEFLWTTAVLGQYFDATAPSQHRNIVNARLAFEGSAVADDDFGPHLARPPAASIDIGQLRTLAEGRRSVRWFKDTPVPRGIIDSAMEIAAEAPTACNRQPYRFEVFDDPTSAAKVAAVPMGTDGYAGQVPNIIAIVGDLSAFFDPRDRHLIYVDSCLAAMGLILGLESQGVSSCCINWPDLPERDDEMKRLIGLTDHERVVMLIAFGYADESGVVPFSGKRPLNLVRRYRSL